MGALIWTVAISITWALVIFQAGRNNRRFLFLLGFLLPFYSLSLGLFVQFSWFKIISLILVISILISKRPLYRPRKSLLTPVFLLLVYAALITVGSLMKYQAGGEVSRISSFGGDPNFLVRNMAVQYLHFALLITMPLLFTTFVRTRSEVTAAVSGYIAGNVANVFIGIYQSIASLGDLPFLSYWFAVDSFNRVGEGLGHFTTSTGLVFSRMAGLGGEPRHFAAFIAVAIVIIVTNGVSDNPLKISRPRLKLLILTFGLIGSVSVSAVLGLIAAAIVFGIYVIQRHALVSVSGELRNRDERDFLRVLLVMLLVLLGMVLLYQTNSGLRSVVYDNVYQRADTIDDLSRAAPRDALTYDLLAKNGYVLSVGAGAGGNVFYILERWAEEGHDPGNNLAPSSFWIKFVAEYGLIGTGLLGWMLWVMVQRIRGSAYHRLAVLLPVTGIALAMFASLLAFSVLFMFLSILYAQAERFAPPHSEAALTPAITSVDRAPSP
jgi:hypothetical protein